MKTSNLADISKQIEEIDKQINENKRRIRLLSETNSILSTRRSLQVKIKTLLKEADELDKELRDTREKVNSAWNEKIQLEKMRTDQLEKEWKQLIQEIEANADTPGYQQAIKHTDLQTGLHKHDVPSTRTNYKNMAARLQNEIKSLQQTVNSARLSLIDEIKKKTKLEEEVRELRVNLSQHRRSPTPSKLVSSSIPELNLRSIVN